MRVATAARPGRPILLLTVWAVLLAMFAALAPVAQSAFAVPFELVSLVMFAPALACVIVLIRPAWLGRWWPRTSAGSVVVAAAIALLAVLTFAGCLMLFSGREPAWPPSGLVAPVWMFLCLQAVGVLCEEVGWRGLVQRAGERFARRGIVAAVAGFLFGATHLGYWPLGPLPVLIFAVTAMLMSLTITTIFVGNLWQRMIPAVIVHLGVNVTIACFAGQDEPLATTIPALAAAAAMLVLVVVIKGVFPKAHVIDVWRSPPARSTAA